MVTPSRLLSVTAAVNNDVVHPTLQLIVYKDVRWGLQQSRPAINHVNSALVLQLLSAFLQRLNEVFIRVSADHPSLQHNTRSVSVLIQKVVLLLI